tara:strand:- start:402 stop:2294 length:1893 start_codon:yes stop_codon:yes gene_type:complete
MPLTKLQFKPGINRDITSYSNEGGWVDSEKIRFRLGFPEKIGGWVKYSTNTFLGTCRALHTWVALNGTKYLGLGTNLKYYVEIGGSYGDITPIRKTSTNTITFAKVLNGSPLLNVTDSSNGSVENDFVTFSGAATLGGVITAEVLNQEYQIVSVTNGNVYVISAKDTSGGTVNANSSDTGNGGSGVDGLYQINVGLDTQVGGPGWGAGTWGRLEWGAGTDLTTVTELRLWSHDNYGEDLLINPRDGGIYYWDSSSGTTTRAVEIGSVSGASETPTVAKQIMVSDNNRHVIAFGTNTINTSVQDPLLIRFSDQENYLDWDPQVTNSAGDLRIGSGSSFVRAIETKREILIWTNSSLHSMSFLGAPFTFGITPLSTGITIMSSNAIAAVNDIVFWMGKDSFYMYDGQTKQLPCSVKEQVFFNFNEQQEQKVFAGVNSEFNEITWFYCSKDNSTANGGTGENDKYVTFNYGENVWYYGTLSRTSFMDRGLQSNPIAASSGYLYNHEVGYDDDGSAMTASLESSPIDIGDGEKFVSINEIIPDFTFNGSTEASPTVNMTLSMQNFPGSSYSQASTNLTTLTASSTTTVPFEQFTQKANIRLRGRSFALKVDSTGSGVRWRLGSPRINLREDGRR